jgi:hypothetical protein
MTERTYNPVTIARQFLYVREAQSVGQNRGLRVESIQHWADGAFGDSWCQEFLWFVFDIAYQGHPPFPRMQACETLHRLAVASGWIVHVPRVGDIVLSVNGTGHAHHCGLITSIAPLTSIAGNTSEDGTSSNGDRVAEHTISPTNKVFLRIP